MLRPLLYISGGGLEIGRCGQRINRRQLLKRGIAAASAGILMSALTRQTNAGQLPMLAPVQTGHAPIDPASGWRIPTTGIEERSIAELQEMMASGTLTARQLTSRYLARIRSIDQQGPQLKSFIETNSEALAIADQLDRERRAGKVRGPLHGIPIALKDNIDTVDQMKTTAGSLALVDSMPLHDATVAAKLRAAGAILIGKTGLSEWANMRSSYTSSGWSARGGQVRNPYAVDRNPGGSSSGSAAAPSANLTVAAVGTETDGSIAYPASICGVVGIKPSVGLTSRAGVVPISDTQDSVGPLGRTVADAAAVLTTIAGVDERDSATVEAQHVSDDYTQFLNSDGLSSARIGVARQLFGYSAAADAIVNQLLLVMAEAGATIVDPVWLDTPGGGAENLLLLYEFKWGIAEYLAGRTENSPKTLGDLIQFNFDHAAQELQWFDQAVFLQANQMGPLSDSDYQWALQASRDASRRSLDRAFDDNQLDAIIAPTAPPAWPIDLASGDYAGSGSSAVAARAGYPLITVPAGFSGQLPVGITFIGRRWDEGRLIRLASGFEVTINARQQPEFLPTLPG